VKALISAPKSDVFAHVHAHYYLIFQAGKERALSLTNWKFEFFFHFIICSAAVVFSGTIGRVDSLNALHSQAGRFHYVFELINKHMTTPATCIKQPWCKCPPPPRFRDAAFRNVHQISQNALFAASHVVCILYLTLGIYGVFLCVCSHVWLSFMSCDCCEKMKY
jgi:hypothetical protein